MLSLYKRQQQLWTLKNMRSILKQTSMDSITPSITFNNYCDERIQIMKNSADEYARFLTQLDNFITRIDLTMETMRLPFKRKTVHFTEHNEVFLIPPRETSPILTVPNFDVQNLQSLFPDWFYWTMPPSQNSCSCQTAFSSDVLFWNSSTTTDIRHAYQLLSGRRDIQDNYATFVFLQQMIIQQEEESDRWLQYEQNELALLREFAEAAFQETCTGGHDTILQPMIHLWEERNHCHHHRTGLSPLMIPSDSSSLPSPSKDQDNDLTFPWLLLNPRITLALQFLEPHLAPSTIL